MDLGYFPIRAIIGGGIAHKMGDFIRYCRCLPDTGSFAGYKTQWRVIFSDEELRTIQTDDPVFYIHRDSYSGDMGLLDCLGTVFFQGSRNPFFSQRRLAHGSRIWAVASVFFQNVWGIADWIPGTGECALLPNVISSAGKYVYIFTDRIAGQRFFKSHSVFTDVCGTGHRYRHLDFSGKQTV